MFLVTGLAKLREEDASAVDAWEVLKMATVNGARAMYLPDNSFPMMSTIKNRIIPANTKPSICTS